MTVLIYTDLVRGLIWADHLPYPLEAWDLERVEIAGIHGISDQEESDRRLRRYAESVISE